MTSTVTPDCDSVVDEPPELAARQRIDAAGRLVEKDDRRLVEDRAAERQPLAPAAGEIARAASCSRPRRPGHLEDERGAAPRAAPASRP